MKNNLKLLRAHDHVQHKKVSKNVKSLAVGGMIVMAALTIFGVLSLHKLQTQYSVMQFLPKHHPALSADQSVRRRFQMPDLPMFIGLVSLAQDEEGSWFSAERMQHLKEVSATIRGWDRVHSVIAISNVSGAADVDGALNVGPLVEITPQRLWKKRILSDQLLTPNLITKDGRTVLIYVVLKDARVESLVSAEEELKDLLAREFPRSHTSIGGVPAVQTDLGLLLLKELRNFLLLSFLSCALILILIFRSYLTMLIPLALTAFANIMVLALMAWTGLTFTILSSTIPILVFITVVALSAHVLLRIYEDAHHAPSGESKWQLIVRTNKAIWLPNLLGALTTCVGFLTLLSGDVPLIRNYGIAVAEAVMLSWLLTSLGILPFLILMPLPEPRAWVFQPARWALWVMNHRKAVVGVTLVACATLAFVGRHLEWKGKLFDDLPKDQDARRTTERIDQKMGGVVPLQIVITADKKEAWNDPQQIAKLDKLLTEFRHTIGVGSAYGIPDFMRASGIHARSKLPASRGGAAEIYFLYAMSTDNPLKQYLTDDGKAARVELRLHDLPSDRMQSLLRRLQHRVRTVFPDSRVQFGGMGAIVHLVHDQLSKELIFGFWQALLLIVILLALIFRSPRWALVACVPNLVPPIALLGYLSLTHTPIKPGVAIIFSIALGLAFNNTVYVLNRMKALRRIGKELPITKTFYLEGNPCLVSTLIVMAGFSVFLFSYFELNKTFGACMLVSITGGLIGDLIFLPALLRMYPWLLERQAPLSALSLPGVKGERTWTLRHEPTENDYINKLVGGK